MPALFCGQPAACHGEYVPECLPSFLSECFDDVSGKHCFACIHGFCQPAFRTGSKNDCTGSGGTDLLAIRRNHLVSAKDAKCFVQFNSSGRELYAGYDSYGPEQCNGFFYIPIWKCYTGCLKNRRNYWLPWLRKSRLVSSLPASLSGTTVYPPQAPYKLALRGLPEKDFITQEQGVYQVYDRFFRNLAEGEFLRFCRCLDVFF